MLNFSNTRYGGRKYFTVDHQQWKPPYYHWSWFRKMVFQFILPWVPCIDEYLDLLDWRWITNLSKRKKKQIWSSCSEILEITLLLNVCPKIYVIIFGNSYLFLRYQFAFRPYVKESTMVQVMALKFLYPLFFNAMSKE